MAQALESFDTISLAGGGNRCWWQAGVLDAWLSSHRLQAQRFVGTSAGAAIAAATLSGTLPQAIDNCRRLYAENPSVWRGRSGAWFAHEVIYPAWINSYLCDAALTRLRNSGKALWVGVGRLPRALPVWTGVLLGTGAYLADKYYGTHLHPKLASWCGLRSELHNLNTVPDRQAGIHLLISAAAAPPFIACRHLQGRTAVDGGFVDNAPRLPLDESNCAHLMLLTRHYPKRPLMFYFQGRTYLQPSMPIPVSTWDCTRRTDIMAAVVLGQQDGVNALRYLNQR
jgi:predicted acylesterase/phospholipase RssA